MEGITPETRINDWLVKNGYKPVEKDARIHDCYDFGIHWVKEEVEE